MTFSIVLNVVLVLILAVVGVTLRRALYMMAVALRAIDASPGDLDGVAAAAVFRKVAADWKIEAVNFVGGRATRGAPNDADATRRSRGRGHRALVPQDRHSRRRR